MLGCETNDQCGCMHTLASFCARARPLFQGPWHLQRSLWPAPISWRQIFGADFVFPGCQPRTLVAALAAEGVSPKLLLQDLSGQFVFLEGVSPKTLAARSLWPVCFLGRCQPQTLAAGSLVPVYFLEGVSPKWGQLVLWKVSAPNSCCRICGASFFWEGLSPKLLLPDLWGQLVRWKVSAPNAANFESPVASVAAAGLIAAVV